MFSTDLFRADLHYGEKKKVLINTKLLEKYYTPSAAFCLLMSNISL